jgi:hypothetical protein
MLIAGRWVVALAPMTVIKTETKGPGALLKVEVYQSERRRVRKTKMTTLRRCWHLKTLPENGAAENGAAAYCGVAGVDAVASMAVKGEA